MLDRLFVEERINKITDLILEKERWLKYAKDAETVNSIWFDIQTLREERDIYLMLL